MAKKIFKIFGKVLLGILGFIVLLLIIGLFIDGNYSVEREIVIKKPNTEVFDYMKYLKNQDNYTVWNSMDKNMKKEYVGVDGTVGFISKWDSENDNVGAGEQEITKLEYGKRAEVKLRFLRPFKSESDAFYSTNFIDSNTTKVVWGIKGSSPYPFNLMKLFMNMDEMIGKDFETNLTNLKNVLENKH